MSPAKSARNADNDRAAPDGRSALELGAERAIGSGAERRDGSAPLAAQDTDRDARTGTRQDIQKDGTTDSGTGATPGPADDHPADAGDGRPAGSGDGAAEETAAPSAREPRPRIAVLLGVAAVAYALDLISKLVVVAKLEGEAPIDVIGDWLQFRGTRNPGAAFGMGQAYTIVFTLIAASVIVVILRIARKLYSLPWGIALGLLLGGALGNLTDRLLRSPGFLRGHVVDFIAPKHFAVFNLADSAIVVGGCLIVLLSFLGLQPDGTREGDELEDADEAESAAEADGGVDGKGEAEGDGEGERTG